MSDRRRNGVKLTKCNKLTNSGVVNHKMSVTEHLIIRIIKMRYWNKIMFKLIIPSWHCNRRKVLNTEGKTREL